MAPGRPPSFWLPGPCGQGFRRKAPYLQGFDQERRTSAGDIRGPDGSGCGSFGQGGHRGAEHHGRAGQAEVEGIAHAVHAPVLKHGEKRTLQAAHAAVTKWWAGVKKGRREDYRHLREGNQKRLKALRDCLNQAARTDRFELVLEKLPAVYTGDVAGAGFTEKEAEGVQELADDVKMVETGLMRLRNEMAEALSSVMGSKRRSAALR